MAIAAFNNAGGGGSPGGGGSFLRRFYITQSWVKGVYQKDVSGITYKTYLQQEVATAIHIGDEQYRSLVEHSNDLFNQVGITASHSGSNSPGASGTRLLDTRTVYLSGTQSLFPTPPDANKWHLLDLGTGQIVADDNQGTLPVVIDPVSDTWTLYNGGSFFVPLADDLIPWGHGLVYPKPDTVGGATPYLHRGFNLTFMNRPYDEEPRSTFGARLRSLLAFRSKRPGITRMPNL